MPVLSALASFALQLRLACSTIQGKVDRATHDAQAAVQHFSPATWTGICYRPRRFRITALPPSPRMR